MRLKSRPSLPLRSRPFGDLRFFFTSTHLPPLPNTLTLNDHNWSNTTGLHLTELPQLISFIYAVRLHKFVLQVPVNMTANSIQPRLALVATLECSQPGGLHDTVVIQENDNRPTSLRLTFRRTIKVADSNERSDLPPDLGTYPLAQVDGPIASNLPSDMQAKGGLFFPMHGMWYTL